MLDELKFGAADSLTHAEVLLPLILATSIQTFYLCLLLDRLVVYSPFKSSMSYYCDVHKPVEYNFSHDCPPTVTCTNRVLLLVAAYAHTVCRVFSRRCTGEREGQAKRAISWRRELLGPVQKT